MDFLNKNKIAIGGAVVLIIAGFVYFTYLGGTKSPAITTSDTTIALSQQTLAVLRNLHTIKLDNSIFSDPAFGTLTDFGITIPPQTVGRRNPFLPLSRSSNTGAAINSKVTIPTVH